MIPQLGEFIAMLLAYVGNARARAAFQRVDFLECTRQNSDANR